MKGKEAARAARDEAERRGQRIAELEQQLAAERDRSKRQEVELRTEIGSLQGRLAREVATLADARVDDVTERLQAELRSEREAHQQRVYEACRFLVTSDGFLMKPGASAHFFDLLGMGEHYGELIGSTSGARNNRRLRRATTSDARFSEMAATLPGPGGAPYRQRPSSTAGHVLDDATRQD